VACVTKPGGLYNVHPIWRDGIKKVATALLVKAINAPTDPYGSYRAIVALQLLPGIICYTGEHTSNFGKPIRVLEAMEAAEDLVTHILDLATSMRKFQGSPEATAGVRRARRLGSAPAIAKSVLAREATKRVAEGRTKVGLKIAEQLQETIDHPNRADERRTFPIEQLKEAVERLFPAASEFDILPTADTLDPPPLVMSSHEISTTIRGLQVDSSNGCSAWTNKLVMILAVHGPEDEQAHFIELLTELGNLYLAGNLHPLCRDLLNMGRAVPIGKKDGGIRIIVVGDVIVRVWNRVACGLVSQGVGERLAPLQVGVGISSGCEIAAHMHDLQYSRTEETATPHGLLPIDAENAYNKAYRQSILEGTKTYCPVLVRAFKFNYGKPSELRASDGTVIGECGTGTRQGDNLSGVYYAVGTQSMLMEIDAKRLEIKKDLQDSRGPEQPPTVEGYLMAYHDDNTIGDEIEVLLRLAPHIEPIYAKRGLKVNTSKTFFAGPRVAVYMEEQGLLDEDGNMKDGTTFSIHRGGLELLGAPIGTATYQRMFVFDKVTKMAAPDEALCYLHPKAAQTILQQCVNTRPAFLFGVLNPEITEEATKTFDKQTDTTLQKILHLPKPLDALGKLQRGLPRKLGGMGMRRYEGKFAARLSLSKRKTTYEFVAPHPALKTLVDNNKTTHHAWLATEFAAAQGGADDVAEDTVVDMGHLYNESTSAKEFAAELKQAEFKGLGRMRTEIINHILQPDPPAAPGARRSLEEQARIAFGPTLAAWAVSSATQGAMRFTYSSQAPYSEGGSFASQDYRGAVSLSLGQPVAAAPNEQVELHCGCCRSTADPRYGIGAVVYPHHALTCWKYQGTRTARHNAVCSKLAAYFSRIPGMEVKREVDVATAEKTSRGEICKADLVVNYKNLEYIIDVAIVAPTTQSLAELRSASPMDTPGLAATIAEGKKCDHYRAFITRERMPHFIPFVMEATGRLGTAAVQFLVDLELPKHTRTSLLYDLSAIVAKFNGKMVDSMRSNLSVAPRHQTSFAAR
jgi:hypothetical protein